jgi:hypothetical protein
VYSRDCKEFLESYGTSVRISRKESKSKLSVGSIGIHRFGCTLAVVTATAKRGQKNTQQAGDGSLIDRQLLRRFTITCCLKTIFQGLVQEFELQQYFLKRYSMISYGSIVELKRALWIYFPTDSFYY